MSDFIELFKHSMALYNLPYTIMFGLVVVYWLIYIVTGADVDTGGDIDMDMDMDLDVGGPELDVGADMDVGADLDMDADVDIGLDGDVDVDMDADLDVAGAHHGGGAFEAALGFIHGGSVPMMIILTVMIISMWTCAVLGTHWFPFLQGFWSLLFVIPNVLIAAVATKLLLWPFVPFFHQMMHDDSAKVKLIGKTCIVKSLEIKDRPGHGEFKRDGAPLTLTIIPKAGEVLKKGEEVLIYGKQKDELVYKVTKIHEDPNS